MNVLKKILKFIRHHGFPVSKGGGPKDMIPPSVFYATDITRALVYTKNTYRSVFSPYLGEMQCVVDNKIDFVM